MSKGSLYQKTIFLGQKVCSVVCPQTHTQSENPGHGFRIFSSTYQGSANKSRLQGKWNSCWAMYWSKAMI